MASLSNGLVTSFIEVHYLASFLRNFAMNDMQISYLWHITVHICILKQQFLVWKNVKRNYKRHMLTYKLRFVVCQCNFRKFVMDNVREIRTTLKNIMHCDVISMIFAYIIQSKISQERSKITNFCKRSYQPILPYLHWDLKCELGEISLHKHFKY